VAYGRVHPSGDLAVGKESDSKRREKRLKDKAIWRGGNGPKSTGARGPAWAKCSMKKKRVEGRAVNRGGRSMN